MTRRNLRPVADSYEQLEVLTDQAPGGAVATFTFSADVDLVWFVAQGGDARATDASQTPSASFGIPCFEDTPTPVLVHGTAFKVFAAGGVTVSVWGMRYNAA